MNPDSDFSYRGTGRTTCQMLAAPRGAIYVCVHEQDARWYSRHLAHKLGRGDLKLVGPHWLEHHWQGRELTGLVLDHACHLTDEQRCNYQCALACVQKRA